MGRKKGLFKAFHMYKVSRVGDGKTNPRTCSELRDS